MSNASADRTEEIEPALEQIRTREGRRPEIGMILGSGLGALADAAEDAEAFETANLPGYPPSTVEGHQGRIVFGSIEGKDVVILQGRVHSYEGHERQSVTFPIRLMHALGVRDLLITNAAGGVNPRFVPGTLMFIVDHVNWAFVSPLMGPNKDGGPRFPDMSAPYDPAWIDEAERLALDVGIRTERGVYGWTHGPGYETPAEVRALRHIGVDAVGMSTVPEVIQARYLDMRVLGISTITNPAAGLAPEPLDHEEVLEVGRLVRADLERLVRAIVRSR